MISWPIRAALRSNAFEMVVVSTDDPEIERLAKRLGAEVISRSSHDLSNDFATTTAVLHDCIAQTLAEEGDPWVYKIYPTTPASPKEVLEFVDFTELESSGFAVSVTRSLSSVQRALVMESSRALRFREPEFALVRSQDLEPTFFDAGKMYGGRKSDWLRTESPLLSSARGFELPDWLSVDLDTVEDWELAEYKIKRKHGTH